MAYQINKTDGSILTTVPDSQIDENSTNLTLIGKNYSGFGEAFNENLVKLLENFADTRAPDKPITGQIWFDVSELKVKVYNGNQFVPVSSATISNSRPSSLGIGDLWYDNINKQLFFFDGDNTVLLAPIYTVEQNLSGLEVRSILDSLNQTRVITLLYNNGILIGIFSKDSFTPKAAIDGFSGSIEPGFNAGSLPGIKFRVTVTNSEQLGGADALTYVRRDTSNSIDGQIRITSDLGLIVGAAGQGSFVVNDGNLLISNSASGQQITISVRKGIDQETSLQISPNDRIVDFYPTFQDSQVRVGGNLTIAGNLTVQGTTTTINTANVTIEDKTLELAFQTGVTPTDENADEGGIILRGASPKLIIWSKDGGSYPGMAGGLLSTAWNFSESINLGTNKTINIDGVPVIEQTSDVPGSQTFRLTNAVTTIAGVSSFGTQTVLNVGPGNPPVAELRIETDPVTGNPRISTLSGNLDLELAPSGSGNIVLIGSPRIIDLADPLPKPTDPLEPDPGKQQAATREYVDRSIESRTIVLSIDLSDGKSNSYIATNILNNLCPPAEFRDGTLVKMLCSITSNSSTSIDLNPLVQETKITVSTPSGTAQALSGVALGTAILPGSGISITRIIKQFQLVSGAWAHVSPDTSLPL
jgi:hypothetical protein